MQLSSHMEPLDALRWLVEMGAADCVEAMPQMPWAREIRGKNDAKTLQNDAKMQQNDAFSAQNAQEFSTPKPAAFAREVDAIFGAHAGAQSPTASPSLAAAVAEARALADAATDLSTLELAVHSFSGCALKRTASSTVFADGVATGGVMLIGDPPGTDDDRQAIPFSGEVGVLLDKMLRAIGLSRRENTYLSTCLFWRPPGNRQPTPEELAICRPLVEKHIALVNPRLLILMGGAATQSLLNDTRGITRLRGQQVEYKNEYLAKPVPTHILYHPSYLLRQPLAKKQTWADLLAIQAALAASSA